MIGSFHVLEFRRRVFTPPRRPPEGASGLRFWAALNIAGDFGWFRDHPSRWSLYPKLRPDFRRWAFYAVWDEEAALDEFLTASPTGRSWADQCVEAWHLWLRPLRVRGPWEGMQLLQGSESGGRPAGPVAVLARLNLNLRGTLAMWGSAAPRLLPHIPDDDELLAGIAITDRPYTQPMSFSLWRNSESALRFAYQDTGHGRAVARVQQSQNDAVERFSAGRFDPYRSAGTWKGREPLHAAVQH